MDESKPDPARPRNGVSVPADAMVVAPLNTPTEAGQAARPAAQGLAKKATAPAMMRAYKADWTHLAA